MISDTPTADAFWILLIAELFIMLLFMFEATPLIALLFSFVSGATHCSMLISLVWTLIGLWIPVLFKYVGAVCWKKNPVLFVVPLYPFNTANCDLKKAIINSNFKNIYIFIAVFLITFYFWISQFQSYEHIISLFFRFIVPLFWHCFYFFIILCEFSITHVLIMWLLLLIFNHVRLGHCFIW